MPMPTSSCLPLSRRHGNAGGHENHRPHRRTQLVLDRAVLPRAQRAGAGAPRRSRLGADRPAVAGLLGGPRPPAGRRLGSGRSSAGHGRATLPGRRCGGGPDLLQPDAPRRRRRRGRARRAAAPHHRRDRRPGAGPWLVAARGARRPVGDGGGLLRRTPGPRRAAGPCPRPHRPGRGGPRDLRRADPGAGRRRVPHRVLRCTEIELLVTSADSPIPLLDSMRVHAEAAVGHALGDRAGSTSGWAR
jgi:hypothetical protein